MTAKKAAATKPPAKKKSPAPKPKRLTATKPAATKPPAPKPKRLTATKPAATKSPASKPPASKPATTKSPASKPAAKKSPAKKQPPAPRPPADALPLDGTALDTLLDLAGAGPSQPSQALAELERQLGAAVPGELRRWLARPLDLARPDVDVPAVTFAGPLPDVPAWLAALARPTGTLLAIPQLVGAWPLGVKRERGDPLWIFAGLERYGDLDSGGAFHCDGRALGGHATLSALLHAELTAHWQAHDAAGDEAPDLRDTSPLRRPDPRRRPPAPLPLPAAAADAWDRHARRVAARFDRVAALLLVLRGHTPDLAALPTEAQWLAERAAVATGHAAAMYWLLAHWLLDNREELADAVARTADHPSPLVAALRAHVQAHDAAATYAAQQAAVFDAVRRAAL